MKIKFLPFFQYFNTIYLHNLFFYYTFASNIKNMAHKTREEYKKNCKFYVLGWCCENQPIKKKVCKSDCDRMKKYKTKIS